MRDSNVDGKRGEVDPLTTMDTDLPERKLDIWEHIYEGGKPIEELRGETMILHPVKSFSYIKGNYTGFPKMWKNDSRRYKSMMLPAVKVKMNLVPV